MDATKKVSMAAGGFAPYPPLIHSQAVFNAFTPLSLLDNSGLQNEDEDEDGPMVAEHRLGRGFLITSRKRTFVLNPMSFIHFNIVCTIS